MARPAVDVRRAGVGDLDELVLLWAQAREDALHGTRMFGSAGVDQLQVRLREALASGGLTVLLACWDGRPAGYALTRIMPVSPLLEGPTLLVDHLYVASGLRRRGVGHALLAAVAGLAERNGADQIIGAAPLGARDTHRFLARLGFSPLVAHRIVATATLRRRLAGEGRRGALEDLLSRRRSLRARSVAADPGTGGAPAICPPAGIPSMGVPSIDGLPSEAAILPVRSHDTLEMPAVAAPMAPLPPARRLHGAGLPRA